MFEYRKLRHEDYDDIVDIAKDIWGGSDYLPEVFHGWVDYPAEFIGGVDTLKNKVVSAGRYSVLYDGTGWIEALRVHKDYRGMKLGLGILEALFSKAEEDMKAGKIIKIACSTYYSNLESVGMLTKFGFKPADRQILIHKTDCLKKQDDFNYEPWNISFDEFMNLEYFKRRNGIIQLAFIFQRPTKELYNEFIEDKCFVRINGMRGFYKYKGEPYFIAVDDHFEAIDTLMDYYVLTNSHRVPFISPSTSIMPCDRELIDKLKTAGYHAGNDWQPNYFYLVYGK